MTPSRPWRARRCLAVVAAAGLVAAVAVGTPSHPADAFPYPDVHLVVHGWGHGRGMGQYGALGYALAGTTYQDILAHYYGQLAGGGTTTLDRLPGGNPENAGVRVSLVWNAGNVATIVTSGSAFLVGGQQFSAGQVVEMVATGGAAGAVATGDLYVSSSCAGPWSATPAVSGVALEAQPVTPAPFPAPAQQSQVLALCRGGGNEYVRGVVYVTHNLNGDNRTVNELPLEQYVADSAPAESPASWGTLGQPGPQGQPWGFQQTEAQVVATRSYVASSPGGYGGYADTCDTTSCQSYPGIAQENATTTAAVLDTEPAPSDGSVAGQVVLMPDGSVARTEYSSSTGGYSAPGTFAAVPDDGDAVCTSQVCNPYHRYDVEIPVGDIESTFPQIGTLVGVTVTQRNGYGDFGGRVLQVQIAGTQQSVTVTGSQFAADFAGDGMNGYALSDWFMVVNEPSGGVGGYWLAAADGGVFSFGDASFYGSMGGHPLNAPVVGMAATPDGRGYWLVGADGGVFSFGDAGFYGSLPGDRIVASAAGMLATADGGGYLVVTTGGRAVEFGDAPQFGDATSVPGWSGTLVGGATTP